MLNTSTTNTPNTHTHPPPTETHGHTLMPHTETRGHIHIKIYIYHSLKHTERKNIYKHIPASVYTKTIPTLHLSFRFHGYLTIQVSSSELLYEGLVTCVFAEMVSDVVGLVVEKGILIVDEIHLSWWRDGKNKTKHEPFRKK